MTVSMTALSGMAIAGKPVSDGEYMDKAAATKTINNDYWWPNRLDLSPLRANHPASNPLGADFDYKAAFESLYRKSIVPCDKNYLEINLAVE